MNQYGRGMAAMAQNSRMQQQPAYQFYENQEDDEDDDEYGQNDYYDEEDDDIDEEELRQQYMQNITPGSLFQGPGAMGGQMAGIKYQGPGASQPPQRMSAQAMGGGIGGYPGMASAPLGGAPLGYGGMGGAGAMGGLGAGLGGGLGGGIGSSGGGISYGMASKAGPATFGGPSTSTQFGAMGGAGGFQASAASNPGLFSFGGASQFGGIGSAGGLFGSAPGGGIGGGDAYGNIQLDLNKIKKPVAPPKNYEQKTEEEKKKDQTSKSTGKSNLKKGEAEEEEKAARERKRSVTFGKSTTYEVDRETENSVNTDFNKQDVGEKGSPRPTKKVIGEKDLSNGQNEKQKIKELLEQQEKEQLDQAKKMGAWKPETKKDETAASGSKFSSMGQDLKKAVQEDESIGESSSMSRDQYSNRFGNKKQAQQKKEEQSYSEDFDSSLSGSLQKESKRSKENKLVYWPGKDNIGDSSASNSMKNDPKKVTESGVYDGNQMEEYIKKQQQLKSGGISQPTQKASSASKAEASHRSISESSDKYEDEEFDSISKSQLGMSSSLMQSPDALRTQINKQQQQLLDKKAQQAKSYGTQSIVQAYIKKENKQTMTDLGKYSFIDPNDATTAGGTYKEWTLQQNLKDAELLIQDLKAQNAELKQTQKQSDIDHKKREVELSNARREVMGLTESNKSLSDRLADAVHKVNVYKIELEGLIKQIDLADAKTREKEDELRLSVVEYDRKLQLQEERILMRRSKAEDREVYEVKRQFQIERETISRQLEEKAEELDYFQQKVTKLEQENKNLKVQGQSNKRIKELEDQVEIMRHELNQANSTIQLKENIDLKNLKNDLSKDDQIRIQKELAQAEHLIQGYEKENQKLILNQKQQDKTIKQLNERIFNEQRKTKDMQQKTLLENQQVYVEKKAPELDIQTVNDMGTKGAISQKDLQELYQQIQILTTEKQDADRNLTIKEGQLKVQIQTLRDEKETIEKQLLDTEFVVGGKDKELIRIKDELAKITSNKNHEIRDLEDKIQWFRDNQKLMDNDDKDRQNVMKELSDLRSKKKQFDDDKQKIALLEKNNKQLEETIKSKSPNSIPMLIQAAKKQTTTTDDGEIKMLHTKIKDLEGELANRDEEFDRKLRTLRQEHERMRTLYEKKQGLSADAKRVAELETELDKQKTYFIKRIKEIEDKKLGPNVKPPKTTTTGDLSSKPDKQLAGLQDQVEQLTKERNILGQKVFDLEMGKRRSSQTGAQMFDVDSNTSNDKNIYIGLNSLVSLINSLPKHDQNILDLLHACIICVEQLKPSDPIKNKLSLKLKSLAEHQKDDKSSNNQITNEIMQICKSQLGQPHSISNQKSEPIMNQDLKTVMSANKYQQPFASPSGSHQKTPSTGPLRSVKQLLKAIAQSGVDIERMIDSNKSKNNKIALPQMYNALKEAIPNLSLEEARSIKDFVNASASKDDEDDVAELLNHGDDIDCQALMNVLMDVTLDPIHVGRGSAQQPARYQSQDKFSLMADNKQQSKQITDLQLTIEEVKMEYEHELKQVRGANAKYQQVISQMKEDMQETKQRMNDMEQHKDRLEKILKTSMAKTHNKKQLGEQDIVEEITMVLKRIELLEDQSDERERQQLLEHQPCQNQIKVLQDQLESERADKVRQLAKKTSEVAYFKAELDTLMNEMRSTLVKKQHQQTKVKS